MEKQLLKKLKKELEAEKKRITKDLKSFAKKDKTKKGDWRSKFPFFGNDRSHKDESAEEIEEYATRLSLERTLEARLKDIETAIEKTKKGAYGKCEVCGNEIEEKRLKAVPEAKWCLNCAEKQNP
jgi:RNA polymerase-binding transcription factor DksA